MSKFPSEIDDDSTLSVINDNINELGGQAINELREAVVNVETEIGIGASGTAGSIASRLTVALLPDGSLRSSALTSLGLITLPITNDQIVSNAGIPESKLALDYSTQNLYNYIQDLQSDIITGLGWIATSGSKLEPHIAGSIYKHYLNHVLVSAPTSYLENKFRLFRDNSNAFEVINDLNTELLEHQWADGSAFGVISDVETNNGSTYPSNYAHTASGVFLNTGKFTTVPQTIQDMQQFADFMDSSSLFLLGGRIKNLYSNGISRESSSSSFLADGYGQAITPSVPAVTYLLSTGIESSPFDDIDKGDDIVELFPPSPLTANHEFDAAFALVKVGDIIRVNYGTIEVPYIIKERKYIQSGLTKKFYVRINGKNLEYSTTATAKIDRPLVNFNKYGALSICAVNNSFSEIPSLIVGSPRSAQVLGVGFDPDLLNSTHYALYLAIFPTGNVSDGYTILPGIDVTGNLGATPGKYTLESVVEATNTAFRQVGYNYRFMAFSHNGEFGVMLTDTYNNASFSVVSAVYASDGSIDETETLAELPNNVIGMFEISGVDPVDPLGFGPTASNIASPPYTSSYGSAAAALFPTKLYVPLKRNNYYVGGIERDKLASDVSQVIDDNGDTYWDGYVKSINSVPGAFPSGHVEVTYMVNLDLSTSKLKAGKTITIQSLSQGGDLIDFGRFIIKSVSFVDCAPDIGTEITVYDAVHGEGISPATVLDVNSVVALYFDSSSVSFNKESATDISLSSSPAFKRHFEVFITDSGDTFTHERARMNISGSTITVNGTVPLYSYSELGKINIIKVSPKLRGYEFGSVSKINLNISYNDTTGVYSGYLSNYDGSTHTKKGTTLSCRKGEVVRFYDETNIDYIDVIFEANTVVSDFSNKNISIQLFPSLSLDNEVMLIGTCQLNDTTKQVNYVRDYRQFGNTSEKDLTTSALNMIALPEKLLHQNGVISGFELSTESVSGGEVKLLGGTVLVDGKIINVNNHTVIIPTITEYYSSNYYNIKWALCINSKGEYQPIALLDYDLILSTPDNINRVIQAFNPNNGQYYYIDCSTFSNIVNNRKDLTILYLIEATVVAAPLPSTISLVKRDARRFVNDVDSNLPLKLTTGKAQGNFKTAESILNWLQFNHNFNANANLCGSDGETGYIRNQTILNFKHSVTIVGEKNSEIIFDVGAALKLGSNITFKDIRVSFQSLITVLDTSENIHFENCDLYFTTTEIVPDNVLIDIVDGSNISFKNCSFYVTFDNAYDGGALFRLNNTSKFVFDNNYVEITYNTGGVVPGQVFVLLSSDGCKITNSTVEGNFLQFIVNEKSNNLLVSGNDITTTYTVGLTDTFADDASSGMPRSLSYNTLNLINSGRGLIYANISTTLENIIIDNNTFSYSPNTSDTNRISFINFELDSYLSELINVTITNCKFKHTVSSSTDDIRAAISIINRAQAVTTVYSQPIVYNLNISNNYCNKNQMIAITSTLNRSGEMVYPGLVTQNGSIKNNICGTIGYWTSGETKYTNLPLSINALGDKSSGLTIDNNVCHLIINIDETGMYYMPTKYISAISGPDYTTNICEYSSGNVTINNNKLNWIHVANTYEPQTSINILNNSLCAYDLQYLAYYNDIPSMNYLSVTSYGYAIFVASTVYNEAPTSAINSSPDSSCIISGNTINAGYWITPSFTTETYLYARGYIFSQGSSIVTNNICKGIDETIVVIPIGVGILLGGITSIVTGNKIYRNGKSIFSYIGFGNADAPSWDGANSNGIVTSNYFDSPWVTDTAHTDTSEAAVVTINVLGASAANRWLVENNINQTSWKYIPITGSNMTTYDDKFILSDDGYSYINHAPGKNTFAFNKSLILHIHEDDLATPSEKKFGWQADLTSSLPDNVKIVKMSMSMRKFNTIVDTGVTSAYLSLNKYSVTDYLDLDVFTGPYDYSPSPPVPVPVGLKDPHITNDDSPPSIYIGGFTINASPLSILMEIDTVAGTDVSESYTTNRAYAMTASLSFVYQRVAGSDLDVYFSPLLVKYRW